ncbi:TPA: hypothetical protein JDH54_000895 [Salmonella enterica subsp. enterica]|nr:hypothetical protein [Salmonella enterica subsp. enterica serovar Soerenga]
MKPEIFDNQKGNELVSTDEFIKFIYSFNSKLTCPVCRQGLWDTQGLVKIEAVEGEPPVDVIESLNYSRYIAEEDRTNAYPGGLPLFRVTCHNCAYIMLFSYKRVRALIAKQAEEAAQKKGGHDA